MLYNWCFWSNIWI